MNIPPLPGYKERGWLPWAEAIDAAVRAGLTPADLADLATRQELADVLAGLITPEQLSGALATKLNSATYVAGMAGKADLVAGQVPDEQLPVRLSPAQLEAAFAAVLQPSDDTTGATDTAVINAALAAGTVLTLTGGTFHIRSPGVVMPSNSTLELRDATLRLIDGANCPLVSNSAQNTTGNDNIRIKGRGRALFHGNAINQVRQSSILANVGMSWVNVRGLVIEDVQIGPTNAFACLSQGVTDARFSRINLEQDDATVNQDGIDLGPGCKRVRIEGTTGKTHDDAHSIFAKKATTAGSNVVHPLFQPGGALEAQGDVEDISIFHTSVDAADCMLRLQAADGLKLLRFTADGITNLNTNTNNPLVQFGPIGYAVTPPALGDLAQITVKNIKGGCRFNAQVVIAVDVSVQDVVIDGVHLHRQWPGALVGTSVSSGTAPTVSGLTVSGVRGRDLGNGTVQGDLVAFRAGSVVTGLNISDVKLGGCRSITKNAGAVQLHMRNVWIGKCYGIPFASTVAETGTIDSVTVAALDAAVTKRYGVAMAARLGWDMPRFTSADTLPSAVEGSVLRSDGSVDPTGDAFSGWAAYISDGTNWTRVGATAPGSGTAFPIKAVTAVNALWKPSNSSAATQPVLAAASPSSGVRRFTTAPTAAGFWMEWVIEVRTAGSYELGVLYQAAAGAGIWQASIDSIDTGTPVDAYAASNTGQYNVQTGVALTAGSRIVRITVTDKNASATNYGLYLSGLTLQRVA